ncbi:mycothiol transferase [Gordonia sp. NPDC003429]
MGFLAPTVTDEHDALTRFLVQQCEQLRTTALGLDDAQSRLTPTAGALSILGLLTHVAQCVEMWMSSVESAPARRTVEQVAELTAQMGLPVENFSGAEVPDLGLDDVVAVYDRLVTSLPARIAVFDLDARVPVPDAPWFPKDLESWNVRWVLDHLITEVARHAGQADIIRESIDGAIAYELNARAEGQEWHG